MFCWSYKGADMQTLRGNRNRLYVYIYAPVAAHSSFAEVTFEVCTEIFKQFLSMQLGVTLKINASVSKDWGQRAPTNSQNSPVCLPFSEKVSPPHQTRLAEETMKEDRKLFVHLHPTHQDALEAHAEFNCRGRYQAYLNGTVASQ